MRYVYFPPVTEEKGLWVNPHHVESLTQIGQRTELGLTSGDKFMTNFQIDLVMEQLESAK